MASQLAKAGILTCVLQYSLYPDAVAPQMVDELSQALTWTFNNISKHGGNPNQVQQACIMIASVAAKLTTAVKPSLPDDFMYTVSSKLNCMADIAAFLRGHFLADLHDVGHVSCWRC